MLAEAGNICFGLRWNPAWDREATEAGSVPRISYDGWNQKPATPSVSIAHLGAAQFSKPLFQDAVGGIPMERSEQQKIPAGILVLLRKSGDE